LLAIKASTARKRTDDDERRMNSQVVARCPSWTIEQGMAHHKSALAPFSLHMPVIIYSLKVAAAMPALQLTRSKTCPEVKFDRTRF
jgi:hypothetical protein